MAQWLSGRVLEFIYFLTCVSLKKDCNIYAILYNYKCIDLCLGGHGVLLNSKSHIDQWGAEVSMIKFTVQ